MLAKEMKIGLVSPFPPEKDGIAIYSDNILKGLGKNKKHIIKIGRKGSKADYIIDFKSLSLKKDLERVIKKEKISAIHFQYVATLFGKRFLNYNLIDVLKLSVPIIVTLHEVHYSNKGIKNKVLAQIEKKIVKTANKIIVHTPKQEEFLKRKYKTNKITTIYHGLRLNKIPKKKNKKNILCFGMISQAKGVPYLVRAMKYLPDYNLTIAGNFIDKQAKQGVITALKKSRSTIKTEFKWIGEEKKEIYYKNTNMVILPHTWAPYQSGILHNSVAWGLPVVTTKVGALYEIVELFKFGEIVKPRSPIALAEGIKKVQKNQKYYEKGIERYRKSANWPKIANEHLNIYKKISNR